MKKFSILGKTEKMDWFFIGVTLLLMGIGVLLVYSATSTVSEIPFYQTLWFKQITYFLAGIVIAIGFTFIKITVWRKIALPLYLVSLVLLLVVLFFAGDVKGAGRWIDLGFFKLQPSEFAKIAYLLMISTWLSKHPVDFLKFKTFVVPGLLFIFPFVLVLRQPDLSTALVFTMVTLTGLFMAGLRLSEVFFIVSPFFSVILSHSQVAYSQLFWGGFICVLGFLLYRRRLPIALGMAIFLINIFAGYTSTMAWNHLEPHQQKRVETFFNPMADPKGDGYQVLQSMTAIGSGGLSGKGFGNGTQTNLSFLPEEHTDFIFSVLGEQFGFIGCAIVLILYFLFLWRAMEIAKLYAHPFVVILSSGVCAIIFFHVTVNIAMTIGLMPVTGLPLPFLSYGGSFAMTCMCLVGLLCNMRLQGYKMKGKN